MSWLLAAIGLAATIALSQAHGVALGLVLWSWLAACGWCLHRPESARKLLLLLVAGSCLAGFRSFDPPTQAFEAMLALWSAVVLARLQADDASRGSSWLHVAWLAWLGWIIGSLASLPWSWFLGEGLAAADGLPVWEILDARPHDPWYGFRLLMRIGILAGAVAAIARSTVALQVRSQLVRGLPIAIVCTLVLGFTEFFGLIHLRWWRQDIGEQDNVLRSLFLHRGWMGAFLIAVVPFVLGVFLRQTTWWLRVLVMLLLIALEVALVLSGGRASWLIYPLVLFIAWFGIFMVKDGQVVVGRLLSLRALWVVASIPITLIVSLGFVFLFVFPSHSGGQRDGAPSTQEVIIGRMKGIVQSDDRTRIWMKALAVNCEHPWLGSGVGSFAGRFLAERADRSSALDIYENPPYDGGKRWNNVPVYTDTPHNTILMQWTNGGMVAVALWAAAVCLTGLALLRGLWGGRTAREDLPPLVSWLGFASYSVFNSLSYILVVCWIGTLCIGLALNRATSSHLGRLPRGTGTMALGISLLASVGFRVLADPPRWQHPDTIAFAPVVMTGMAETELRPQEHPIRFLHRHATLNNVPGGLYRLGFVCPPELLTDGPFDLYVAIDGQQHQVHRWRPGSFPSPVLILPGPAEAAFQVDLVSSKTFRPLVAGGLPDAEAVSLLLVDFKALDAPPALGLGLWPGEELPEADHLAGFGDLAHWTGPRAALPVPPGAERMALRVWAPRLAPLARVGVTITDDLGHPLHELEVRAPSAVPREPLDLPLTFQGRRARWIVVIPDSTWNPAHVGSQDFRDLGVMVNLPR